MMDATPKYFTIWDRLNDDDKLKIITKFGEEKFDNRKEEVQNYLLTNKFKPKVKGNVVTK